MIQHIPVLIVGAGPTGLTMACELARRGIPFKIIDQNTEQTRGANAVWIQSRTLELFDSMDLAKRFIKVGNPCHAINLYVNGKELKSIPFSHIDSPYPYILILPQNETERLLNERLAELKHHVDRQLTLISINEENKHITATLQQASGTTKTITCDWLIACDGANSTVRKLAHIDFPGEDLSEQFVVANAYIDSFTTKDEIHVFFKKHTVFAAFPLGSNYYRIAANLHMGAPRKTFHEHEVIDIVKERAYNEFSVTDVTWISPFWIHGKIASTFQKNRLFLLGDAAHIHSMVGGQGMNTGIQDAINLAWKLSLVIQEKAHHSLLNTYESERLPIANEVVKRSNDFTKTILFDNEFISHVKQFARSTEVDASNTTKEISNMISQVNIQYQLSPIIDYSVQTNPLAPQPGERAPDVKISESKRLYDYLHKFSHHLLIFTGHHTTDEIIQDISHLKEQLEHKYGELLSVHIISQNKQLNLKHVIDDHEATIHQRYHVTSACTYLLRPDQYIACYTQSLKSVAIENVLDRYLTVK